MDRILAEQRYPSSARATAFCATAFTRNTSLPRPEDEFVAPYSARACDRPITCRVSIAARPRLSESKRYARLGGQCRGRDSNPRGVTPLRGGIDQSTAMLIAASNDGDSKRSPMRSPTSSEPVLRSRRRRTDPRPPRSRRRRARCPPDRCRSRGRPKGQARRDRTRDRRASAPEPHAAPGRRDPTPTN